MCWRARSARMRGRAEPHPTSLSTTSSRAGSCALSCDLSWLEICSQTSAADSGASFGSSTDPPDPRYSRRMAPGWVSRSACTYRHRSLSIAPCGAVDSTVHNRAWAAARMEGGRCACAQNSPAPALQEPTRRPLVAAGRAALPKALPPSSTRARGRARAQVQASAHVRHGRLRGMLRIIVLGGFQPPFPCRGPQTALKFSFPQR